MRKKLNFSAKGVRAQRRAVYLSILLAGLLLFSWYIGKTMCSLISVYAVSYAETTMSDTANRAVYQILEERGVSYQDLVQITRGEGNEVTALEVNTILVNQLKALMSTEISRLLVTKESETLKVPIGSLLNYELFWGRGPKIPFKLDITGTVLSDFKSRFETAGINQTLHQIVVEVSAQAHILMPFCRQSCTVKTTFIIAQTVIVGKVPEAYTYVSENDPEDITGDIFDFGAGIG